MKKYFLNDRRQKNQRFFSYNFLTKNRKGADKIISVYWFAILFIVAAAVVYMVAVFYGKPYDIRGLEADILTDKVAGCFSEAGYMFEEWGTITNENFLKTCVLNFNVEDSHGWDNDQYYAEVFVKNFTSEQIFSEIVAGNSNLKTFCSLQGEGLPVCVNRGLYLIDREGNQYEINILSIVRKTEKNVQ